MPKVPFSLRIKRYRVSNLMSQEDLAIAMGISLRNYQYLESGSTQPREVTIQKLNSLQEKLKNRKYKKSQIVRIAQKQTIAKISDAKIAREKVS